MWNSMQKKIVLIILVLLFIMTISGTVTAAGSNITNCTICNKNIANPIKCNDIAQPTAQNNYCNAYTLPSCPQFSCTIPKYTCGATTGILSTCSPNPHESAIIDPNICTTNYLNTNNCGNNPCTGNNPPICVIPSIPNICDPGQIIIPTIPNICDPGQNNRPSDPGDITNVTGEIKNNGGISGKPKVNAAILPLLETGLPLSFLVAAILMVFTGLLPKRK